MSLTLDPVRGVAEAMMRMYAPAASPGRKWATPGDLAKAIDPSTVQTPALDLIDQNLVALADGDFDRLMVFVSPQEGKSTRVSQRFVEWMLIQNPDLRVAIVSYSDEIARRWGSDIKLDVETFNGDEGTLDLGITLRADSRAAGRWQIEGHKGGVFCCGVSGSLTGRPVDLWVWDDPLKDLEQAQSKKYRDRARRFYQAVAVPRLGPGSKAVLICTRWNEDDPAGWLQQNEPDRWKIVSIPAIAESDDDPLGREIGEPMISARGERDWVRIRESVGEYVWASLYQQRPAPAEGGLFKRASLRYWSAMPADFSRHGNTGGRRVDLGGRVVYLDDTWRFLTVDLAASTRTSADYTAAGVWAVSNEGDLILLDGVAAQVEEADHWGLIRPLRERWAADTVFVESRMFGTTLVYEAGRNGVPVQELKADTDKFTRALPASARASQGRLWLPSAGDWVTGLVDQLVAFPNAAHDDWCDVVAYAARVVAAHWLPDQPAVLTGVGRRRVDEGAIGDAFASATGQHPNGTNYFNLQY